MAYSLQPSREKTIFLGQYSAVWQALHLFRAGVLLPPASIYLAKHFIKSIHPDLHHKRWGQTRTGTPLAMESLLLKSYPQLPENSYIALKSVNESLSAAIQELRQGGIQIFEVDSVDKVNIQGNNFEIAVSINKNDPDQQYGHSDVVAPKVKAEPSTANKHSVVKKNPKSLVTRIYQEPVTNATMFNTLTLPRSHEDPTINSMPDSLEIYKNPPASLGQNEQGCPKLIVGFGPSAVWIAEHFPRDDVRFVIRGSAESKLALFEKNPRNTATIRAIRERMSSGHSPFIDTSNITLTAEQILSATGNRYDKFRPNIEKFLQQYPHLEPSEVAVIINKERQIIFIGQGLKALGYVPNTKVIDASLLSKKNSQKQPLVYNLQTETNEQETTVAPQNIKGSVLHSMDWQIVDKLAEHYRLTIKQKMLLIPIERLFFRKGYHDKIISEYFQTRGTILHKKFFDELYQMVENQKAVGNLNEVENMILNVYKKVYPNLNIQNFQKALHEIIIEKNKIISKAEPEAAIPLVKAQLEGIKAQHTDKLHKEKIIGKKLSLADKLQVVADLGHIKTQLKELEHGKATKKNTEVTKLVTIKFSQQTENLLNSLPLNGTIVVKSRILNREQLIATYKKLENRLEAVGQKKLNLMDERIIRQDLRNIQIIFKDTFQVPIADALYQSGLPGPAPDQSPKGKKRF